MVELENIFGKSAQIKVLQNLIQHKGEVTYLSGIAKETGLSHSSVARVLTPLLNVHIVDEKRLGMQIRTFSLNLDSDLTETLLAFCEKIDKIDV